MKKALITGITGQDGAYLAKFLLKKGYEVHGIRRRSSSFNTQRIDDIYTDPFDQDNRFIIHFGDLADTSSITSIIQQVQPDEIYNLGAMSHVKVSFEIPEYTADVDGVGTLRILEAIRFLKLENKTKFYQASSSELYGLVQETPQKETTPFYPRSPYGVAKLYAYWITVNYREAYNIFACNGILFNHESPLRGETFITRKITRAIARMALGLEEKMHLGNLDAKRDWGHAEDYVEAMWLMLQQNKADDYVISTGVTTSVREFLQLAFEEVGVKVKFEGQGLDEKAIISTVSLDNKYNFKPGQIVAEVNERYFRPTEVDLLIGDCTKAKEKLGWKPRHDLKSLVSEMVKSDLEIFSREKVLKKAGYHTFQNINY